MEIYYQSVSDETEHVTETIEEEKDAVVDPLASVTGIAHEVTEGKVNKLPVLFIIEMMLPISRKKRRLTQLNGFHE